MVLVQRVVKPGMMVLVFEGNDEGKTVEQILAETICRLNKDGEGVSSWAIHFCSMHHPFSATQRLREMGAAFKKWWLKDLMGRIDPMEIFIPGSDDYAYRFVKREFRYYFSPHFITWLREEYLEKEPGDVPAH